MTSEGKKFAAIFVGIGVVFVGGLVYFLKVHTPNKAKAAARDELVEWDAKWATVRTCLVGDNPASGKIPEAIAIRTFDSGSAKTSCAKFAGQLARPGGEATGIEAIEQGWEELERAANKLANAIVKYDKGERNAPLQATFDGVLVARNTLGDAMGADPVAPLSGPALAPAKLLPVATKARFDMGGSTVSATGAVFLGGGDRVFLAPGAEPRIAEQSTLFPGLPDDSWGAEADEEGVATMALGAKRTRSNETLVKTKDVPRLNFAIGTAQDGIVVGGNEAGFVVLRGKVGAFAADPQVKSANWTTAVDVGGRGLVLWVEGKDKAARTRGAILRPGRPDQAFELGDTDPRSIMNGCFSRDRAWLQGNGELIGIGVGEPALPTMRRNVSHQLAGCGVDGVVATTGTELEVCTASCRSLTYRAATGGTKLITTFALAGGKLVAITAEGAVVRVLREGGTPTYYALPEAVDLAYGVARPPMALSDGKVIDVLAHTSTGYVVVRVPVPS
ncbi:MAG: hypothetical protein KIT31_25145 [Deltaproteobacteria bacterium]|nr:hypothetical protein [Deltaproteobacteria bacterium]